MKSLINQSVSVLILVLLLVLGLSIEATEVSKSPKIVDFVDRLNHPEGTNATFTCSIGSGDLNGLSYEWFKDDRKISPTGNLQKVRISTAPENYQSVLRVVDLKPNDSAVYSCIARNQFGQDKISTILAVKVQLKWIQEPKDLETSVGKSVHIPCVADGLPAPRIEWTKLEDKGSTTTRFIGPELSINSVELDHAGLYECRAKNGADKDLVSRMRLNVLVLLSLLGQSHSSEVSKSPKIVDQAEKLNHPEGTNATFMCSIGSGELDGLTYEWLRDDKRIVQSNRIRISIAPENFNSILRVIDLMPEDSGTYSCVARNPFGQDRISIKLFVKVQLKWIQEPKDVEVSVGRPIHIPCSASGQPPPQIRWTRLMGQTSQELGSELHFDSIEQAHSGEYQCRATNGVEKDLVSRVRLNVLGRK